MSIATIGLIAGLIAFITLIQFAIQTADTARILRRIEQHLERRENSS